MTDPKAILHEGVPWSMEFDPSTGGYFPRFTITNPGGEPSYYDNALLTIDYAHNKVHSGDTFQAMSYTGSVANNGSIDLVIILTGTSHQHHIEWIVACGGDCEILFYEGITGSGYGSLIPSYNLNRNSSNIADAQIFQNPTITVNGILLFNFLSPGGAGGVTSGGEFRSGTERILAPGQRYRLQAFNRAGTAQPMSIGLQWYEED